MTRAIMARPTMPPTTPPAIAPALLDFFGVTESEVSGLLEVLLGPVGAKLVLEGICAASSR